MGCRNLAKVNLVKNGFYNVIKTLFSIVFPLITVPYISRVLGAENIGKINFSSSYNNFFSLMASLGIATYAMRECGKVSGNRADLEKVASELFSINVCTMIFSYFILGLSLLFVPKLYTYRLIIILYSFTIAFNILGADWLNMAVGDFKFITVRTVLFQFLSLLLMFLLVHNTNDYVVYVCIMILAASGANIVNVLYRRKICKLKFTLKLNLKKHARPVLCFFSLLLAQSVLSNLDIAMLGFMTSDVEVGYYSMAVKLYTTVEKVISSIVLVLIPQLSSLFLCEDYDEINRLLQVTYKFMITLAVPFSIGLCFLSKEILAVVCGEEYVVGALSLSILSMSMFVNLIGASFWGNVVLLPSGGEKQFMIACIIGAIVNSITNYFSISFLGIVGAAITTLLSTTIIFFICVVKRDTRLNVWPGFKDITLPILGGGLIIIICLSSKYLINSYWLRIIFSILASTIGYFGILAIGKSELILFLNNKIKTLIFDKIIK